MNDANHVLGELSIPKAIAKIGIPAMASMLIMAIYNLVDTFFIGMLNDDRALTAVAVAFPIMGLIGAIGQVFGAGAAATVTRAFGSSNEDYANQVGTTIIFTSFIAGVVFMLIGIIFIEPIFRLFGTTDSVMASAKEYGVWMYIGSIFSIPNQTFNNLARAETKAILSLQALSIGAISNIILDPIFMFEMNGFGLNMGIEGASIATTLAQGIAFAYIAFHFFTGKTRITPKLKYISFNKTIYKEVFKTGAPIGVTQALTTLAVSFTNIAAISYAPEIVYGENIQSAYGVVLKVNSVLQMIIMGYLMGYQPLVSFAYGAKNKKRFYEAFRFVRKILFIFTIPLTIIGQIAAPYIMMGFSKNPQIIEMGTIFIRMNLIFFVLVALSYFWMITFQATGNGLFGSIIALSRQGILYIPTLFLACHFIGIDTIYYVQPIADFLTALIGFILFTRYKRQLEVYFDSK